MYIYIYIYIHIYDCQTHACLTSASPPSPAVRKLPLHRYIWREDNIVECRTLLGIIAITITINTISITIMVTSISTIFTMTIIVTNILTTID